MFKVGDIIVGGENAAYAYTCTGSICIVTSIDQNENPHMERRIKVKIIYSPTSENQRGREWWINESLFFLSSTLNSIKII